MPKKIGEFLKEKGLVTGTQLDTALRAQLLCGGHIGTCLMELGVIDESSLGEALAENACVPYAPPKVLKNLAPKTIRALPRKFAERCRAVPISVEEDTIHLCLIDPRNLVFLDEIAFATGYRVKPWVSPEVRVYEALDRYYGVRRSARYITLCRSLEASERMVELAAPAATAMDRHREIQVPRGEGTVGVPPALLSDVGMPDQGGEYGYGRCWKEIAVDIGLDRRRPDASHAERAAGAPSLNTPNDGALHPTIREATDKLCRIETKEEAADAVLEYMSVRMARSIFFGVNDHVASVWDSRGSVFDRKRKEKAVFPLNSENLFELLLGDEYFRGPLPSRRHFLSFYSALGIEKPQEILLFPVYFDDNLVACIYGDGGPTGTIVGETDEYVRLFRILPLAIKQILLKDSMRAIGYFISDEDATLTVSGDPSNP